MNNDVILSRGELRIKSIWEQHNTARTSLPCTESDIEVVSVFESFWNRCELSALDGRLDRRSGELEIDYCRLIEAMRSIASDFDELVSSQPERVLRQLGVAMDLHRDWTPKSGAHCKIRLKAVKPEVSLTTLRAATVGRLVCVRGQVTRIGAVKPLVCSAWFACIKCGERMEERTVFADGKYYAPRSCESEHCKSMSMEPQRETAETIDVQAIKLQQYDTAAEELERLPQHIEIELVGSELVDQCTPGDELVVAGVVKSLNADVARGRHDKRALERSIFLLYIEANSVFNATRSLPSSSQDEAESESLDSFLQHNYDLGASTSSSTTLSRERRFFHILQGNSRAIVSRLVASLCPSIYGHLSAKLGLLLGLFSGDQVHPGGTTMTHGNNLPSEKAVRKNLLTKRANSHVLLLGDPGLGKSQMLRACAAVAPRSIYVGGNTSTTTGLTASVSREARQGAALEAGALVLADSGCVAIDEFEKMDQAQHAGLLEAMEQQQISIAKAGVAARLSARTTVLAAANPSGGQYDRDRAVTENCSKLPAPLLSRFDLIFVLIDDPHHCSDAWLSSHVIRQHNRHALGNPSPAHSIRLTSREPQNRSHQRIDQDASNDTIPWTLLREYLSAAQSRPAPRLTLSAAQLLRSTFLKMRSEANANNTPVTMRQLESLVRLAKARARLELQSIVTCDHAADVIALYGSSVMDPCRKLGTRGAAGKSSAPLTAASSDSKIITALICMLHDASIATNSSWFTLKEIKQRLRNYSDLEAAIRGKPTKSVEDYIDILRDQNFLLYQKRDDQASFASAAEYAYRFLGGCN